MKENYEFVFKTIYGSQNYNLDTETSDKDYKMMSSSMQGYLFCFV